MRSALLLQIGRQFLLLKTSTMSSGTVALPLPLLTRRTC
jgi:hypothetical protein